MKNIQGDDFCCSMSRVAHLVAMPVMYWWVLYVTEVSHGRKRFVC